MRRSLGGPKLDHSHHREAQSLMLESGGRSNLTSEVRDDERMIMAALCRNSEP